MLEVCILKHGAESTAQLSLPATDFELIDALEKANITSEHDLYDVEVLGSRLSDLPNLIPGRANLHELNLLAKQLASMNQRAIDCFEGMVIMDAAKTGYAPIAVERLINMTYSTDDCQIAYEVHNDEALGRFYADNDFPVLPENLPEAVYDLLEYEKIGKQLRDAEGGVFTKNGYVVHSGEISQRYSSAHLPCPQKPDYVFLLEIATLPQGDEPNDQNCVTVKLPCTLKTLECSLAEIGAGSIEDCCCYKYESSIPQLSEVYGASEDFDQINELANVITGFTEKQVCTYKAMLEAAPNDITIEEALELSQQIQNFSLIREAATPAEYAMHMLSKYCIELQDELFANANLHRYGERLIAEKGIALTEYGTLWSMDGQTVEQCLNRELPMMSMGMK